MARRVTDVFKKGGKAVAQKGGKAVQLPSQSVVCKVMEHIVVNVSSIMHCAEDNNIITPEQHGFRHGHSCESQLLCQAD